MAHMYHIKYGFTSEFCLHLHCLIHFGINSTGGTRPRCVQQGLDANQVAFGIDLRLVVKPQLLALECLA